MKFNIGDKVKYIGKTSPFIPCNSVGTIICPEDSDEGYRVLFSNKGAKWCYKKNLIPMIVKNQQLLFSFMD